MKKPLIVAARHGSSDGSSAADCSVAGRSVVAWRHADGPVARVAGVALIGLGIACWPGPPLIGMLTYSATVGLYLAYLGLAGGLGGVLLWPAIILHLALTALLAKAALSPASGTD